MSYLYQDCEGPTILDSTQAYAISLTSWVGWEAGKRTLVFDSVRFGHVLYLVFFFSLVSACSSSRRAPTLSQASPALSSGTLLTTFQSTSGWYTQHAKLQRSPLSGLCRCTSLMALSHRSISVAITSTNNQGLTLVVWSMPVSTLHSQVWYMYPVLHLYFFVRPDPSEC